MTDATDLIEQQPVGRRPELAPVEHLTLQERVYRQLKTALMAGRFAPGQTLTIKSLAEAFGTSPMPVRESVRRLSAERAVEVLPNRSVRLPILTRRRFDDLWQVRELVEGEAARLAAIHGTPTMLLRIKTLNERLATSMARNRAADMVRSNQAFHFAVYQASGNDTLLPIIESLWLQSGPLLAAAYAKGSPLNDTLKDSTAIHHAAIVVALQSGAANDACEAMRADIRAAAEAFRTRHEFPPDAPEEV